MEKERNEVAEECKWSIDEVYANEKEVLEDVEKLEQIVEELATYQGKIMENSNTLYDFYTLNEKMNRLEAKIYVYAHMKCDEDTKNTESQSLKMKVDNAIQKMGEKLAFIGPEMLKTPYEKVLEYIDENPNLEVYRFDLEEMYRYQKHTLSEREEEIITMARNAMGTGHDAFYNLNNADIDYGTITDEQGKEVQLTNANYIRFMGSKDREVRKNVFNTMYKFWEKVTNTVASTLKGQIKENFFASKIHKYDSPLVSSLYKDNIDKKVYTNLIDTVHQNLDKMYEYMDIRKKILGVDELHMYDVYVDLAKDENKEIPFEEGKKMVFEGLKPLGEKYLNDLQKAYDERWMDIYPNIGKKSGAYSWGCYDTKPFVLLNYDGTLDAVSTMAHELGHSMHSYYSDLTQPYIYSNYPIFLAEIASTVNETLLNEYLYKNAKSKEEKIQCLTDFLDKVRTTICRQTMFAEFEMLIHDKEENGIPLTSEEICNTYYELNKLYFGENVVSDEEIRYEWERIPHFYTSFYVYKYATGMSAAIAIASRLLNNEDGIQDKYLNFLSSGGSDYPLEILKRVGVDMTTKEPIQAAFDMFEQKLQELKELCSE